MWLAGAIAAGPGVAERYAALVEQLPAVVYVDLPDDADTTVYVSPRVRDVLGIDPDVYVNSETNPWVDALHPDDADEAVATYRRLLAEGGGQYEYRVVRPTDGAVVWIQDRFVLLGDSDDQVVQGFMIDVTREREDAATIATQLEMLRRSERIGAEFTGLVLEHGDVTRIVRAIARAVGNPVILTNALDQVVATSGPGHDSDALGGQFDGHLNSDADTHGGGSAGNIAADVEPVARPRPDPVPGRSPEPVACLWQDVRLREVTWGRVHVLQTQRPADRIDEMALDRGVAALGLALLLEREAGHIAESARSAVAHDLAQGRIGSARELVRRARTQGADLGQGRLVVAVLLPVPSSHDAVRRSQPEATVREVRELAVAARLRAFVAAESDRVVMILAPGAADPVRLLSAVARPEWVVGVSGVDDADRPERAYSQALEAAEHARDLPRSDGNGSAVRFEDLGLRHLLGRLADGPELRRFVDGELGPLVRHDATHSAVLMPTLRAFLHAHGSKTHAARALHVERRTMYYRLDRIAELLGRDLGDAEVRLRLDVAMRGSDLMASREGAG